MFFNYYVSFSPDNVTLIHYSLARNY